MHICNFNDKCNWVNYGSPKRGFNIKLKEKKMKKILMGLSLIAGIFAGSLAYATLPECIDCISCDGTKCVICEGNWCKTCDPKCGAPYPRKIQ